MRLDKETKAMCSVEYGGWVDDVFIYGDDVTVPHVSYCSPDTWASGNFSIFYVQFLGRLIDFGQQPDFIAGVILFFNELLVSIWCLIHDAVRKGPFPIEMRKNGAEEAQKKEQPGHPSCYLVVKTLSPSCSLS